MLLSYALDSHNSECKYILPVWFASTSAKEPLSGQGLQKCVGCSAGWPAYRSWTCDSSSPVVFWIRCAT